jgi:hypothetical protein
MYISEMFIFRDKRGREQKFLRFVVLVVVKMLIVVIWGVMPDSLASGNQKLVTTYKTTHCFNPEDHS